MLEPMLRQGYLRGDYNSGIQHGTCYSKGYGHRGEHCRVSGSPHDSIRSSQTANTKPNTNRVYYFLLVSYTHISASFTGDFLLRILCRGFAEKTLTLTKPHQGMLILIAAKGKRGPSVCT